LALMAAASPAAEVRGRVTDDGGAGVAEAVVWVETTAPEAEPPSAVMDQIGKQFVPHVLAIPVGTAVSFPNHDQIHHHVYSFSRTRTFEIPLYKGEQAPPIVFDRAGVVKVGCNIHDWMSGVILVLPSSHFAVTGPDGSFRIAGVPEGAHRVAVWHEGLKSAAQETSRDVGVGASGAEVHFTIETAPSRRAAGSPR
jgi:plastocyanin